MAHLHLLDGKKLPRGVAERLRREQELTGSEVKERRERQDADVWYSAGHNKARWMLIFEPKFAQTDEPIL